MVRYPEPKAGDKVPLSDIPSEYPFDIEGARKAGYTDQEIADFLAEKTKGARAESATQKRGACVTASKVRALEGIYWSAGLLVAFPLAIYLIGWCIGWVWRGFFPSP